MSGAAMRAVIALTSLALAACNQSEQDDRICHTPSSAAISGDWDACANRWAYRLARSPDPAIVVAKAVATACGDTIAWQVNNADEGEDRQQLAADLMRSLDGFALYYVVQARAGKCDIP